jgi:hypothetical protein
MAARPPHQVRCPYRDLHIPAASRYPGADIPRRSAARAGEAFDEVFAARGRSDHSLRTPPRAPLASPSGAAGMDSN